MSTDEKCELIGKERLSEIMKVWELIWDKVEATWPTLSPREMYNVTAAILNQTLENK